MISPNPLWCRQLFYRGITLLGSCSHLELILDLCKFGLISDLQDIMKVVLDRLTMTENGQIVEVGGTQTLILNDVMLTH